MGRKEVCGRQAGRRNEKKERKTEISTRRLVFGEVFFNINSLLIESL